MTIPAPTMLQSLAEVVKGPVLTPRDAEFEGEVGPLKRISPPPT